VNAADFAEFADHLAESYPGSVRAFVEAHPLHLMAVCGQETRPFHIEAMGEALEHRTMLWLAPRGFGKSNIAIYLGAWLSIAHPDHWHESIDSVALFEGAPERVTPANIRIALVSSTQDAAQMGLFSIKSVLQRPVLTRAFGSLVGEKRWRERSADTSLRSSVRKEPTFSTMGIDAGIAGIHVEVFIADDIYTAANMRTERSREFTREIWNSTIAPTIRPYGRVLVLGTRWARDDLAATLLEKQKLGEWSRVLITPAITEDADGNRESIWPALWPLERLLQKRAEMTERSFRAQYLLDSSGIGGGLYQEEWLQRFLDVESLSDDDKRRAVTTIGIDPAISLGERADHTAIVAITRIADRYFIRECKRFRGTYREIVDQTRAMAKRLGNIHWIVVEATQAQRALVNDFKQYARELPVRGQLPERMSGRDKVGRALAYVRLFEVHEGQPEAKVWFSTPSPANGLDRLIEEMGAFPAEKGGDDCIDALTYAFRGHEISKARLLKVGRRVF
jgi:phage terminase large subunit-like protein